MPEHRPTHGGSDPDRGRWSSATLDPAPKRGLSWQATWTQALTDARDEVAEPCQDMTVRITTPIGVGGSAVRLELSNRFGDRPAVIGHAAVTHASRALDVSCDGERTWAIPAGASVWTDPLPISVEHGDDVMIDLYLPEPTPLATLGGFTFRRSPPGDYAGAAAFPASATAPVHTPARPPDPQTDWVLPAGGPFVRAVEVAGASARAVVACLGASITALGWPQMTAAALDAEERIAVVNRGIPGNRLRSDAPPAHPAWGPSGLSRFEDDVLGTAGVTHVLIAYTGNDISLPGDGAEIGELPSAEELIDAYRELIERATSAGVEVMLATMTALPPSVRDDPARAQLHQAVNEWIRTCDLPVADFERSLSLPADRSRIAAEYDVGDHQHPNRAGQEQLARAATQTIRSVL